MHPFLAHDGPLAIAHRGGTEQAPENTLPAFEDAIGLGFRYLETDARLSRDGVLLAYHDDRLGRLTDRAGEIRELAMAEIETADAGWSYSRDGGRTFPWRGRGVRVPRLSEVLERWPQARVNIDPKSDDAVRPLAALLDRLDAWHRVCIGSFSDRRLRAIRRLAAGRACTSLGPVAVAAARATSLAGRMPRLGGDCVQVPLRRGPVPLADRGFVRAAHASGLAVHVWTVDDAETMHGLLDLGVDGVMTDRPRILREVFAARGLALS